MNLAFLTLLSTALGTAVQLHSLALKFTAGETMRYRESLSVTETSTVKGSARTIKATGGRLITIKVTRASGAAAAMAVSFSGVTASARVSDAGDIPKQERERLETRYAEMLKASMSSQKRTQTVTPRGVTTYKLDLGSGKHLTIENGAFMLAVLPKSATAINSKWTARVAQPDPVAGDPLTVSYKLVGISAADREQSYTVALSAASNRKQTREGVTGSRVMSASGLVKVGKTSGKVLSGEVTSTLTVTLSSPKDGVRSNVRKTVQKFQKL